MDEAGVVYDVARSAARLAKAKGAHDSLLATAHRAQADALEIMSAAARRLADEYDAAQERGEVASQGKPSGVEGLATTADIGLSRKEIHEARIIRDAEVAEVCATTNPGVSSPSKMIVPMMASRLP
jgi:hypothetical protein